MGNMIASLFTASELAEKWGCHKMTVLRIARRHNIGETKGQQRFFTRQEAEAINAIRQPHPGQPKKDFQKK